jgi:adenine-specific DNA-methyltransferase
VAGQKEDIDYLYDETDGELELLRAPRAGEGTDALKDILGSKAFSHPKPPTLIRNLVRQTTAAGDIVMDFFAGSGTTAQAVLELNAEDNGTRRFILVSSTEATDAEQEKNVCRDVCARRVGNVIGGYGNAPGTGGDFVYARFRGVERGRLTDLEHAEIWTLVQLIHREKVAPYSEGRWQWAGDDEQAVLYVPRFCKADAAALCKQVAGSAAAILYSWQSELIRQHVRAEHVQFEHLPESLSRRFGLKG